MAAIVVENLQKSYGDLRAVDGLSFTVEEGEVFGLLGPNGAGKTTTVEILIGLRERDSGRVEVTGFDPAQEGDAVKAQIGVQLQQTELFPLLSVEEILHLFASFYHDSKPVAELLELVGLQERRKAKYRHLSGGQKQRLSLALTLINDPELVFLDEPTTGLDPQARRALWNIVEQMRAQGKTVLLTTHYMEEAEVLCRRVAVIDHGKILALGAPRDLVDQYVPERAIELPLADHSAERRLESLPAVTHVDITEGFAAIHTTDLRESLTAILEKSEDFALSLDDLRIQRGTLEDVFLQLTGRTIRE
ncbi:MAG: ABC transporter ATP-binding protein [Chloroflexota bacterium]|nr:ABC transporter ATP-binding protein [Chloroflexota bacterium]MDE2929820.1 ABC transporter ATP-binding protein [Chloroflexota bacterium]